MINRRKAQSNNRLFFSSFLNTRCIALWLIFFFFLITKKKKQSYAEREKHELSKEKQGTRDKRHPQSPHINLQSCKNLTSAFSRCIRIFISFNVSQRGTCSLHQGSLFPLYYQKLSPTFIIIDE